MIQSINHITYSVSDINQSINFYKYILKANILLESNKTAYFILEGRTRDARDKKSIYFTDPDGHKLELYTGTLQDRFDYYKEEKSHMKFYI